MTGQILNYLGNSHATYLHARGKLSSDKIFKLLAPRKDEKILEIGFGTGATLIKMASQSEANLYGYEISPIMYQKALERVRFCQIPGLNLELLQKKNQFPAPDNTFDAVYAESILAIQEGPDLRNLLFEIKRVLKPNGVLLFNETIWLDVVDRERARAINEKCKKSFGIIQSSHDYLHIADWKNLLTETGFTCELEIPVSEIQATKERMSIPLFRSNLYTFIGKMKASLSPSMRQNWTRYTTEMASIIDSNEKLMEGRIIKAYNKK